MLKWILIGLVLFMVYAQVDKANTNQFVVTGRNAGTGIINWGKSLFASKETNTQVPSGGTYTDGNKTILGPVYIETNCASDMECQEWYKCQGCSCDTSTGKCWY